MMPFFLFIFICFAALLSSPLAAGELTTCSGIVPMKYRSDKISIADFGGVGDGRTLNTRAFRAAIYRIQHLRRRGGTLLYIPPGVYLTESFNLTSHMTLYLAKDAVIKAVQDSSNWPVIEPLPSYGRGREPPWWKIDRHFWKLKFSPPWPNLFEASLYGYNCDAQDLWRDQEDFINRPSQRPNRRMIENSSLTFQETINIKVLKFIRLVCFRLAILTHFIVSLWRS
ncbi:putative polygalacturonase, partial [Cucurbita argyrosperma subsp. sororia]